MVDDTAQGRGAKLLYDDQDLLIHSLRDNLDTQIDEVLIDDEQLLAKAEKYVQAVMPRAKVALKLYAEPMPLFSRFNVEPQIASIYSRTVGLPSGGAIVIDHAEALTAIDVNSGKSKAGKNQGDTASHTNLEAAAEVGRQLRLRDIGGLVVVDFIDMRSRAHRHDVEKALREAMKPDRARHEIGRIGENGLVEINRQRIRSALQLRTRRICPTCDGVGRIISPELLSLNLVRRIEGRAATGRLARAKVVLHSKVADYVQNNRRRELADLERAYRIVVEIVGDPGVELSTERYEWFDVPAWEVPSVPDRRTGDEDDDRSPAVPAAPSDGEPVETPPGMRRRPGSGAAQAGTGAAGRGRRREAFPPQAPAAGAGTGTAAPRSRPPGSGEHPLRRRSGRWSRIDTGTSPPRLSSHPQTRGCPAKRWSRRAEGAPRSGRRPRPPGGRRRRRRRSRGEGAVETREAPPVPQEVPRRSPWMSARTRPGRRPRCRSLPRRRWSNPLQAAAPAPAEARVPEAGGESDREAPAPREEPPVKKAPKKSAPKKAAAPKKPAKAAPKKAAARKGAAEKAPQKSRE